MMEQRALQGELLPLADEWNNLYRLEIVNFNNVLLALPYLIGGMLLCAWVGMPASWKESFVNWAAEVSRRERRESAKPAGNAEICDNLSLTVGKSVKSVSLKGEFFYFLFQFLLYIFLCLFVNRVAVNVN